MGDRANVVVKDSCGGPDLFLYTHWCGSELPAIVQGALAMKKRWDDHAYLARIVFCKMVGPNSLNDETGFGISTSPPDSSYPHIVLDCEKKQVTIETKEKRDVLRSYSFEEFIALSDTELSECRNS